MKRSTMKITRRQALKATAAAVAAPLIVPSHVFGQNAPSNTMLMASIGTGRMGHGDMKACLYSGLKTNARIVAVCDLDLNRAEHAKGEVVAAYDKEFGKGKYQDIEVYGDYRELLKRKDIDGLTISTPDHWHAKIAVEAAKAGKGMYLQKPLAHSIGEGQKLVQAVRKYKVVFQTGSQQRSSVYFRHVCELVRNGFIGQLKQVDVGLPADSGTGKYVEMPVPENLNYDMWLGSTQEVPYTQDRVHPQRGYGRPGWLQIEQFSRGMITGWGAHMYDTAQWGIGNDDSSGPVEIKATAEFPERGLFDVHTKFEGEALYANGIVMTSKTGPAGVRFTGEKGWIWVDRGGFKAENPEVLKSKVPENGVHLYKSNDHMLDYLTALREGRDPICPVEVGHRSNTICVLHHIAMKLGRTLKWDTKKEEFVGDKEANEWLDFKHREPWTVEV